MCNLINTHTGCCCQLLVCFEFWCALFPFAPVYPKRAGWRTRTLVMVFGFGLAGCCSQLVCFEFVVPHFRLPIPETRNRQIVEHVRTEKKQKRPCPAVQGTWLHVGPLLAGVLTQRFSTQPLELYIPRLSRCTPQWVVSCSEYRRRKPQNTSPGVHAHRFECGDNKTGGCSEGLGAFCFFLTHVHTHSYAFNVQAPIHCVHHRSHDHRNCTTPRQL